MVRALYSDHVLLRVHSFHLEFNVEGRIYSFGLPGRSVPPHVHLNCIAKNKCPESQKLDTRRRGENLNATSDMSQRATTCIFLHSFSLIYSIRLPTTVTAKAKSLNVSAIFLPSSVWPFVYKFLFAILQFAEECLVSAVVNVQHDNNIDQKKPVNTISIPNLEMKSPRSCVRVRFNKLHLEMRY